MEDEQKPDDLIDSTTNQLSNLSVSINNDIKYRPMPHPLSVYVPLDSLDEKTIDSIVSTILYTSNSDMNNSKRTLLAFLLAIHKKVSEIENNKNSNNQIDIQTIEHAKRVRQLLVDKHNPENIKPIDWNTLQTRYEEMAGEKGDGMARHFGVTTIEPYYELTIPKLHPDVMQSREYMARFRSHGWNPTELKIYWNSQQLENLCPKYDDENKQIKQNDNKNIEIPNETKVETTKETKIEVKDQKIDETKSEANAETTEETKIEVKDQKIDEAKDVIPKETKVKKVDQVEIENRPSHDPSDVDAVEALRKYPVPKRNHKCIIEYVNKGIENAVFDAPEDAQLIVLNFANERSPGGGYLRHAWAQEEIILFNSDGYRSLLDLKYGRMGGGYAIPEFGLAYVRDIRFVDKKTGKDRKADMMVSACYCLGWSSQLYNNPKSTEKRIENDKAKFRAFMSAAVANTIGDGSNTYLLLGPIGTGAFGNDVEEIGYVFRDVLSSEMMGSKGPIRDAFGHIWFVSTDKWKNDKFEEILNEDTITTTV